MSEYQYEIIQVEFAGSVLKRTDEEGNILWIPLNEANSDFAAFLETADGKAYLEAKATPTE